MNLNPFRFFKKKVVERKIHILTNKAEKKALLRERVANVWFSMTNRERHKKSQLATGRLLHYLNLIEAKTVLFYASMEDEPSTDQILEIWMQDPKRTLVLTRVCNSTKQLDPYKVDSWEQLEMGRFRIRMPHKDCQQIDLTELDAVVVPGRLFDKNKNRIGRGYGFYDRFLTVVPEDVKRIGLAFQFQMTHELPVEEHDVPMDVVITEERTYDLT